MPNLLVVLLESFATVCRLDNLERTRPGAPARRTFQFALAALAGFLVVVTNTEFGRNGDNQTRRQFVAGARTTVILGGLPYSGWTKNETYGVVRNVSICRPICER
jgi:hypothetical protein